MRPLKIGVVTDVGQLEDKSFNQASNEGAMAAAAATGGEHDVIVTQNISDYAANIQTFVDQDFDVIVTVGFLIGTDTAAAAKANPDVHFIGVDQGICVDEQGVSDPTFTCAGDAAALLPNYQGILFAEAQPGYLAGIVAASISESNTIGAVGGTNLPAVVNFWRGYENGAKSVKPDIEVLYQESDPDPVKGFNDPTKGRAIAEQFIGQGADVIFQIAGLTGQGALEAVCDADIHGIGVDVDQALSLPDLAPCIVTSAEKKLVDTVTAVVTSVATDTFAAGPVAYNAASDPVGDRPRAVPRQRGADHARDPGGDRRRARGLRRRVARPVRARQVHGRRQLARPAQSRNISEGRSQDRPSADSWHVMMRATLDPGSPSPAA